MNVPEQELVVRELFERITLPRGRDDPGRYAIALGLFALAAEIRQLTRMTGEIAAKMMDDQ